MPGSAYVCQLHQKIEQPQDVWMTYEVGKASLAERLYSMKIEDKQNQ